VDVRIVVGKCVDSLSRAGGRSGNAGAGASRKLRRRDCRRFLDIRGDGAANKGPRPLSYHNQSFSLMCPKFVEGHRLKSDLGGHVG
jgi:hypothetical protein